MGARHKCQPGRGIIQLKGEEAIGKTERKTTITARPFPLGGTAEHLCLHHYSGLVFVHCRSVLLVQEKFSKEVAIICNVYCTCFIRLSFKSTVKN